jgi:hypothetical protein
MSDSSTLVVKHNVQKTIEEGWTYKASAGSEKVSITGSYKDNFKGWMDRCPNFGSAEPSIPGMVLVDIIASEEPGDMIKVSLVYEQTLKGDYPGRGKDHDTIKRYSVELSNGEEHILSHNRYGSNLEDIELKALFAISNGTETKDEGAGNYADDITSELGLECLAKVRKGTVARKSCGIIWVEKFNTENLSDIEYSKFLKTELPPGGVGGSANKWLYLGTPATESEQGGIFSLEKRWEYSPDGWDAELYPPA